MSFIEIIAAMVVISVALVVALTTMMMVSRHYHMETGLLDGINIIEYYQEEVSHFDAKLCKDHNPPLLQFLCDSNQTTVVVPMSDYPWLDGTLTITKRQEGLIQALDYRLVQDEKTLLRSQQWVAAH